MAVDPGSERSTFSSTGGPSGAVPARRPGRGRELGLWGPAFVAAIAYVDPGNVAANLTAGARFGYLLVWVLVVACLIAVHVQYRSAKLGLVTGRSLPELLGQRLNRPARLAFWVQAEVVAAATDVAEVIGGAVALYLLFGTPLICGGVVVGLASMVLLSVQSRQGQRRFEGMILALLAVITVGFLSALLAHPAPISEVVGGMLPRFAGTDSVLLAASMLGATVMPHAIYLHSALARDRHGHAHGPAQLDRLLRATRHEVVAALVLAGGVNIAMLLAAASSLAGAPGTDTLEGSYAAISSALGTGIATLFAVGLLASGLASTSVGCYAGSAVMAGLLKVQVPLLARRAITLVPALALLASGVDPTWALVLSQVVLSFGIPFALVALVRLTSNRTVMGVHVDSRAAQVVNAICVLLIVSLNLTLIWLTITG